MRVGAYRLSARPFILVAIATFCLRPLIAQTPCSAAPAPPALPAHDKSAEAAADASYEAVVLGSDTCNVAGDPGCRLQIKALQNLETEAVFAAGRSRVCATSGTYSGIPLSATDKLWYKARAGFWMGIAESLQKETDAVNKYGTYKLTDSMKTAYFGFTRQFKPPIITSKLASGTSSVTVQVDVTNFSLPSASHISVCVWAKRPSGADAMDCTLGNSSPKAAPLAEALKATDDNQNDYLPVAADGTYSIALQTPLRVDQYVSVVQRATAGATTPQTSVTALHVEAAERSSPRIGNTLKEGVTKLKVAVDGPPNDVDVYVCLLPAIVSFGNYDCTQPNSVLKPIETTDKASSASAKIKKNAASADFGPIPPLACGAALMLVEVDSVTQEKRYSPPLSVCSIPAPTLDTKLGKGVIYLEGHAEPSLLKKNHVDEYDKEVRITVRSCSVPAGRDPETLCADVKADAHPLTVTNGPNDDHFVVTDKNGFYSANLQMPISCASKGINKTYLSVEALDVGSDARVSSSWKEYCTSGSSQRAERCDREFNDCDEGFSLVGGIEQAGLSAQQLETSAFIRAFTRSPQFFGTSVWASIRLLGAPDASSTANVVSATADPSGTLVTKNFATVGNAIDYIVGLEFNPGLPGFQREGRYSAGFIAGLGATTPLGSKNLTLAYTVPLLTTSECGLLQQRFTQKNGYNPAPSLGTPSVAGTTPQNTSCLFNTSGLSNPGANAGTAVKTLAFTNQDRSNFLLKYAVGIRTVTRFHSGKTVVCGETVTYDPERGPCDRGVVDFVVGQDEAITGGYLRNFVFKIDGVHPLPIAGSKILYIFGNASIRLKRNQNFPPLILQSASLDPLSKSVPDPTVFVLPLKQPNRDFYRFGIGLNLSEILSKLSTKVSDDKTKPATPATPRGGAPATDNATSN